MTEYEEYKPYVALLENRPCLEDHEKGMVITLKLSGHYRTLFEIVNYIKKMEEECKKNEHS